MKMKLSLLATLFIGSTSIANATEAPQLSSFARIASEISNEMASGDQRQKNSWVNRAQNDEFLHKALDGVHEYINKVHPVNVKESEKLVLALLSTRYITNEKWKSHNNLIGNKVWTNNDLIELDRVELGSVEFPLVKARSTIQHDMNAENRIIKGQRLSSTLMRTGFAPIGPDGKPVKLCRLVKHPKASFFELSESESSTFISASRSRMSDFQACVLYSGAMKRYWPNRLEDFYDENHVITRP